MKKPMYLSLSILLIAASSKSMAMGDEQKVQFISLEIEANKVYALDKGAHALSNGDNCRAIHSVLEEKLGLAPEDITANAHNMSINYDEIRNRLGIDKCNTEILDMLNHKLGKIKRLTTIPILWPIFDSMGLNIKGD